MVILLQQYLNRMENAYARALGSIADGDLLHDEEAEEAALREQGGEQTQQDAEYLSGQLAPESQEPTECG